MNRKRDSNNSAIKWLNDRIDPISYKKTSTKMNIAAMIDDAMIAKGWSKKDLMKKMGKKNQSEITRWLSGTQNFTVDKLVELSLLLDIKLVAMYEEKKEDVVDLIFEKHTQTAQKRIESTDDAFIDGIVSSYNTTVPSTNPTVYQQIGYYS
ncbi:MAG: helix-turn-helix transcriptional regulator [Candidatus Kapaibacterium sp.]